MTKQRIKQLANNPQFIPGIFNYCDRWCERCPFTARCLNFALSEEQFAEAMASSLKLKRPVRNDHVTKYSTDSLKADILRYWELI